MPHRRRTRGGNRAVDGNAVIAGGLTVEQAADLELAFPTYSAIILMAARDLKYKLEPAYAGTLPIGYGRKPCEQGAFLTYFCPTRSKRMRGSMTVIVSRMSRTPGLASLAWGGAPRRDRAVANIKSRASRSAKRTGRSCRRSYDLDGLANWSERIVLSSSLGPDAQAAEVRALV